MNLFTERLQRLGGGPLVLHSHLHLVVTGRIGHIAIMDVLDDIDPVVIRQQLADAGIVNGQLVDEDKLNNDPFIQQVYVDANDAAREHEQRLLVVP